jgi:hypothetical protein
VSKRLISEQVAVIYHRNPMEMWIASSGRLCGRDPARSMERLDKRA